MILSHTVLQDSTHPGVLIIHDKLKYSSVVQFEILSKISNPNYEMLMLRNSWIH